MKKQIQAIIPVKGNSERVPKKNIRPFHDTNLLELKISQLKKTNCFADILVSSESTEIIEIAKSYGVSTHLRDPYYSTSHVPMSEVYSHLASISQFEHIAWVNVTNPLFTKELYLGAVEIYNNLDESKHDCLMSVYELKEYVFYNEKPVNFSPFPWPRSQDLKGLSVPSFAINILKAKDLKERGTLVGERPYFFYADRILSHDIDVQSDFDFCEHLYKKSLEPS